MTFVQTRTLIACLGLGGFMLTSACSSSRPSGNGNPEGGIPDGGSPDRAVSPDSGSEPVLPDSAAGAELRWLLDLLNGPAAAITEAEVTPHFGAAFLVQVPPPVLVATLVEIAGRDAPFALRQIESSSPGSLLSGASVVAIVETARHLFIRVNLSVSVGSTPRIGGLQFVPAPEYDVALQDPAAFDGRLPSVAPAARMLISRLEGDGCTTIHGLGAAEAMPIGSLFKIYVLGLLAARIQAGQADWTTMIAIQDALKSLPSGVLQDQPDGSLFSIEDVAGKMISISDNTAADHLIRFLGREAVEAHQANMGHSQPALNVPFLTTRELSILKLSASPEERAAFLAAAPEARRGLLESDYDQRPLPSLGVAVAWSTPIEIDRLEWFASPEDLCRGFAALKRQGEQPTGAPVLGILSMNPGVPIDPAIFSYAGFKGGSEPGVLAFSWLLRRAVDGAWVVVTLGFADGARPVDEFGAIYYALAAIAVAGR